MEIVVGETPDAVSGGQQLVPELVIQRPAAGGAPAPPSRSARAIAALSSGRNRAAPLGSSSLPARSIAAAAASAAAMALPSASAAAVADFLVLLVPRFGLDFLELLAQEELPLGLVHLVTLSLPGYCCPLLTLDIVTKTYCLARALSLSVSQSPRFGVSLSLCGSLCPHRENLTSAVSAAKVLKKSLVIAEGFQS